MAPKSKKKGVKSDVEAPASALSPPSSDLAQPLLAADHQAAEAPETGMVVTTMDTSMVAAAGGSDVESAIVEKEDQEYAEVSWAELIEQFSVLGWIGFGGPAAHIGLFQKRLVEARGWMPPEVFMELFALGQCLPGPTSTQVSFALGVVKKGVLGGLVSGALFQYPGALMMTVLGIVAAHVLKSPPFWVSCAASGVSAVGVALVASAAKGLLTKLCSTRLLAIIATLTAAAAIYWPAQPGLFPLVIIIGGAVTYVQHHLGHDDMGLKSPVKEVVGSMGFGRTTGSVLILIWVIVLFGAMTLVRTLVYDHRKEATPLDWFEVFYRTGSIIYGGGQVVLPMLLGDLVIQDCSQGPCHDEPVVPDGRSWLTSEQFYTGLGLAQAMPGPLFNFAAYLGAVISWNFGHFSVLGAALAWIGLFYPGISLMFAVMPFWQVFRKWNVYRRALDGMNAASVGLILSSCFSMTFGVYAISPFPTTALIIGLLAFTCVDTLKIFEPFVVVGGIALGLLSWKCGLR